MKGWVLLPIVGVAAAAAAALLAGEGDAEGASSSDTTGGGAPPPDVMLPTPGLRRSVVGGRAVIVRVPQKLTRMRVVLYGHGFGATIADVDAQIGAKIEALANPPILVIPQLGPKSELGELATEAGIRTFLQAALDRSIADMGPIDVVVHSGGYKLAAAASTLARSIALLDALYGEIDAFVTFARRGSSRHIVSIFGPTTKDESLTWINRCKAAGVQTHLDTTPAATLSIALVRKSKAVALATSVFHPTVPAVYAAPVVEALEG